MASVNDFRVLGAILPPSEKVSASEVADILSAAIAVSTYGDSILEASRAGAQAVVDLYHDAIAKKAEDEGHDPPVKGAPVYMDATGRAVHVATPGDQVTRAEFAQLLAAVADIANAVKANGQQQQGQPAQEPAQEPQQPPQGSPSVFGGPSPTPGHTEPETGS